MLRAGRHSGGVDETALDIDADVHLHAEVPMVAPLRLRHLVTGERSLFFVKDGAAISVTSAIVPRSGWPSYAPPWRRDRIVLTTAAGQ